MKQNKFTRFLKTVPLKLWLLLAAIVAFSFISNDFGLVDIQKTAIVLAAGIDRNAEKGYTLTAQIAVPKGVDRTTGGTSSVEFVAEGETIADCVSDIYCKTGWVPKFVFCNLIVIGDETAKTENIFDALDFFLRNEYMSDNCFIATCQGTAKELLNSESAIDDTSSMAITKLFSNANVKSGKAMKMSLREFAMGYHSVTESGYMPYIVQHKQETNENSSGNNTSQGSGEQATEYKIYCAERTALFSKGKQVALLGPDETFAFSLIKSNVFTGSLLTEEDGKPVSLTVLNDKGDVSLNTKGAPKVTVKVELTVRLFNRAIPSEIEDVAKNEISDKLKENAKETVLKTVEKVFETSRKSGCDLFKLNQSRYRSSAKKYEEWKDTLLSVVPVTYEINVKTAK